MKTEPKEALKFLYSVEDPADNISMHLTPKDKADHVCRLAFKEGQSSPKIKQLEWEDISDKIIIGIETNTPFGTYNIYKDEEDDIYILWFIYGEKAKKFKTIEEAKSAAQEDFENRVKQCLEL